MKLVDLKKKYEGKFLTYYVADFLLKNNQIKSYEFISRDKDLKIEEFGHNLPAGVGMIVYSKNKDKILLQKEFRLACNSWVYTFPAGLIDKGESPSAAAIREVKEETGVSVIEVIDELPPCFSSQGTSDEKMVIVYCIGEGETKDSSFADEEISSKWYTKEEIKELFKEKVMMSVRTQVFLYEWLHQ